MSKSDKHEFEKKESEKQESEQSPADEPLGFGKKISATWRTIWFFCKKIAAEFIDKNCQKSAAALTYMTLFALVPTMTVTYSMFSVIPAFDGVGDQLQKLIFSHFVPETGSEIANYLNNFSAQARSLTLPGVAVLLVTAYLMLTNIEKTFNVIWGVGQARRGLSSFLLYWAVLSIGPIFLGASLIMSTYLLSMKFMVGETDVLAAVEPLLRILPVVTTSMAFTLMFAAVPNCRVPIGYAAIGGVVTATIFELAKAGFAAFVANSSFRLIYGAFAVVPIFLLWVNFLWMIILGGAIFVRTLAEKDYAAGTQKHTDLLAILLCLDTFQKKQQRGETVDDRDCVRSGIGLVHWQSVRSLLVKRGWIAVTDTGNYVLLRDLGKVSLWDLALLVNLPIETTNSRDDKQVPDWAEQVKQVQLAIADYAKNNMSFSLASLFASPETNEQKSSA